MELGGAKTIGRESRVPDNSLEGTVFRRDKFLLLRISVEKSNGDITS
jgi:hypothetical protein